MKYREIEKDLFKADESFTLVHCISSDFKLGAGIAVQFAKMGVKKELMTSHSPRWNGRGYMIPTFSGREVFNLVTKERYYGKPTYDTITDALFDCKAYMISNGITKIALPKIGCGLDRLKWNNVKSIIFYVFEDEDMDFEILVCLQEQKIKERER